MCGITACIGTDDSVDSLVDGLRRLEYRGYDSAGVAVKNPAGISLTKRVGEVSELVAAVEQNPISGDYGIGHTRWATHGGVTDDNAHPHTDEAERIAVVHNGIISNFQSLRSELEARGHTFSSETDTEVVPHLIEENLRDGATPEEAFRAAVGSLSGSYALAAIIEDEQAIFATRSGSPLVLGVGDGEYYLASDVPAFIQHTERVVYLHDGDFVVVTPDGYDITDSAGRAVDRPVEYVEWDPETATKGGYEHYMYKEINEQPGALRRTTQGRLNTHTGGVELEEFSPEFFADVEQVHLIAMGTSHHAGMYAASLLNSRGIPAHAFMSGEYSVIKPPVTDDTLVIAVSQSGETADTLDAVRRARAAGARTLAVTNVVGSSITRECDDELLIRAGPEIGVAATKTFSSQVTALTLLTERIVEDLLGTKSSDARNLMEALSRLPGDVQEVLDTSTAREIAIEYEGSDAYFFIGRGVAHPVALEGALKFKEISYEHAEGFAASELKHGPLALVTPLSPVFAIFTGHEDEATLSNVKEVQARGAPVIAVTSDQSGEVPEFADHVLSIPETHPDIAGVLANVQLQLVAYHSAKLLERSIDKPRNLAKCVTVE
ncbi:glutamine--fructose-6-phosphate transaminase (isomerizing) (plasmid) [Haloferax mediterranei ATCC 33500]|uniref:Glutamine--fructose-6-phosphate aminotransferase [isomerizing] n=1 Tax=Haloferax mediterranei (strain ATCC 33500 / DSM 1411 / JCM 8866 / NBRC 14739 / NCIMB 2177 / R-4) TaxID=523841 RepID=I3RB17_HALMT|nr:glutamine--fructose-6-phosphate transaminase (isomerizing) [Haloferax mediterranei]AFK21427.1 glutamine--fructose-6-phosphate transaminase (isomerizing) [Haloferax mediterranei ATCC 33500]AHZ24503.1 glucosamine-fructose-6-phosphate aminotransferase [Haloferax mediterranei ATCC 33500]ELZ97255.1 glutamine--fructose-6-phosphate transaminase (isomerizing) [Haloferax mediterranei ATCC 33500]MDX5990443.1 glutamine--fructose-6-phosphate transaminase (isomerizing) [Haloferax mediterranei ATCC 33500]